MRRGDMTVAEQLNSRRQFTDDFKRETVQIVLDGNGSLLGLLWNAWSWLEVNEVRPASGQKGIPKTHKFLIRLFPKTITVASPIVCSAPF